MNLRPSARGASQRQCSCKIVPATARTERERCWSTQSLHRVRSVYCADNFLSGFGLLVLNAAGHLAHKIGRDLRVISVSPELVAYRLCCQNTRPSIHARAKTEQNAAMVEKASAELQTCDH